MFAAAAEVSAYSAVHRRQSWSSGQSLSSVTSQHSEKGSDALLGFNRPDLVDIFAKAVKQGRLQRRLTGNGVEWKNRLVVLTKEKFCTFNEYGELCEFIDLVEFVSCKHYYEQVHLSFAAQLSIFYLKIFFHLTSSLSLPSL